MKLTTTRKILALHRDGVEYVEQMLDLLPTRRLSEFKIRESQAKNCVPGAYGNCKYPTRSLPYYRISLSIKGSDDDFPWGIGAWGRRGWIRHAGVPRQEHVATNIRELIAFVAGHEYFHYGVRSGYLGALNSEQNADAMGYEWLHAYRDGVPPVELAEWVDSLTHSYDEILSGPTIKYSVREELKIASLRAPYCRDIPIPTRKGES